MYSSQNKYLITFVHNNKQLYINQSNIVLRLIVRSIDMYINKITIFYSFILTLFTSVSKYGFKVPLCTYLFTKEIWDMNTLFLLYIIHNHNKKIKY